MKEILNSVTIKVHENVFLKDPMSSDLGRQVLSEGLQMISDIGLEAFTFKKLATNLSTTESAIYRYFDNKHKLLLYYTNWYWVWLDYQLVFNTINIQSAEDRLHKAIRVLVEIPIAEPHDLMDLHKLKALITAEASKAYHTKEVDEENREGVFLSYKRLCKRLADLILELNAEYPFANSLSSLVMEGVHSHDYFAQHLPSLTNFKEGSEEKFQFFYKLIFNTISK